MISLHTGFNANGGTSTLLPVGSRFIEQSDLSFDLINRKTRVIDMTGNRLSILPGGRTFLYRCLFNEKSKQNWPISKIRRISC